MANYTHSRLIVKIKPGVEELWLAAIENHTWINNSIFEPPCYWDIEHYPTKPQSDNNCFEYRAAELKLENAVKESHGKLFDDSPYELNYALGFVFACDIVAYEPNDFDKAVD